MWSSIVWICNKTISDIRLVFLSRPLFHMGKENEKFWISRAQTRLILKGYLDYVEKKATSEYE